jgi:hypothetical protein
MLYEFLNLNQVELIKRCRTKVSQRASPPASALELQHGVPLFLDQLVEALKCEQTQLARLREGRSGSSAASIERRHTAALHGKELLAKGYTVDQVVHGYGDICQAITELAMEIEAPITIAEFHTFNRLLDNAIADAVASYGLHRDKSTSAHGAEDLHERLGAVSDELRALVETSLTALNAIKRGNIGLMGATGTLLEESLIKLREVVDKSLPEIRVSTGMITPPAPAAD